MAARHRIAALASALWGLKIGLPRLDDTRGFWEATLASRLRDDPVADCTDSASRSGSSCVGSVGEGDRYAVVAEGDGQHEIRNYAAYTLLPAIQVATPRTRTSSSTTT